NTLLEYDGAASCARGQLAKSSDDGYRLWHAEIVLVADNVTDHAATRVVIDCDTGVDDAMAIFYGLLSPNIDIVGLTCCWGNTWVETATANTLRLLEIPTTPAVRVAVAPG